jgi:1-aminocyclopropane-1-carboxylate deaminase/D-cysteine desulfhydrase-like pyridoxal-dependent ACC family enzyme
MRNSIISSIIIDNREFLVKRDDLIDPYLAGNKYRKLYTLLQTPKDKLDTIISYGGTQSNAMLAISAICKTKGWKFIYYTKPISNVIKNEKNGNFFHSIKLGMNHIEIDLDNYKTFINTLRFNLSSKTFIIDQGGATKNAFEGVDVLANEIKNADLDIDAIATPSGTGTTALYLALTLPNYKIYTTPSIGDKDYLLEQMGALEDIPNNLIILEPKKKYHFAKPYPEFLEIYKKTKNKAL